MTDVMTQQQRTMSVRERRAMSKTKICVDCGQEKDKEQHFYKSPNSKYYFSMCHECNKIRYHAKYDLVRVRPTRNRTKA